MNGFIIETAKENDVDELADLDALCFEHPWSRDSFERELGHNKLAFYLAAKLPEKEGGKIIGYAGIWLIIDEGHITNIAVHPDFRQKHIASSMMEFLLKETSKAGIKRFTLEVRKNNTAARRFYKKYGFTELGIRSGYYENNEDAYIMWLDTEEDKDGEEKGGEEKC